ncbi:MAG TPA: hypothetical protein VK187_01640 [Geobacteraceae bacterium]|nr:hypothetical protein [Geobacteraceae bacterium]
MDKKVRERAVEGIAKVQVFQAQEGTIAEKMDCRNYACQGVSFHPHPPPGGTLG